ncbi:FAD/NAD(P)-binding domain-containing protein [Plasmodiophora brassicae]|uniref:FAD/NAD(P)-binding domain-containing protein n=1 Tax=Plasmodiophora brassicae TaxID=37360 RepID=A0A3P3YK79_PLABS|nr:unnamed protein product [Plasmodiophora brassicae]
MPDKKNVIVVGGGYGGIAVAQLLDDDFNVFVVDRKDYFFHNIGATRGSVVPGYANNIILPYAKALKNGTVLCGDVTRIDGTSVHVKGQEPPVKADFVVIATGSSYAFPAKTTATTFRDARLMYSQSVQSLAEQPDERVLVVGGGPVGCELAGEIKAHHPKKTVTLVSRGVKLIGTDYPEKFCNKLQAALQCQGIIVKTGVTANVPSSEGVVEKPAKAVLSNGETLEVDRVFFCTGNSHVNNSCFEHTMPVNETGHVKVNEYLQVEGQTNVFAIGDCCDADKGKFAFLAQKMSDIAAHNIKALARGKPLPAKYSKLQVGSTIFVPVGPSSGASVVFGFTFGGFVTRLIKSKHLFSPVYAATVNAEYPDSKEVDIARPDALLSQKTSLPPSIVNALVPGRAQ